MGRLGLRRWLGLAGPVATLAALANLVGPGAPRAVAAEGGATSVVETVHIAVFDAESGSPVSADVTVLVIDPKAQALKHRTEGRDVPRPVLAAGDEIVVGFHDGRDVVRAKVSADGTVPPIRAGSKVRHAQVVLRGPATGTGRSRPAPRLDAHLLITLADKLRKPDGGQANVDLLVREMHPSSDFEVCVPAGAITYVRASSSEAIVWPHWTIVSEGAQHVLHYRWPRVLELRTTEVPEIGGMGKGFVYPDYLRRWDADPEEVNASGWFAIGLGQFPGGWEHDMLRLTGVPVMPAHLIVLFESGVLHASLGVDDPPGVIEPPRKVLKGSIPVELAGVPAPKGTLILPGRLDVLAAAYVVAECRLRRLRMPETGERGVLVRGGATLVGEGALTAVLPDGGLAFGEVQEDGRLRLTPAPGSVRLLYSDRTPVAEELRVAVWPRWPHPSRGVEVPSLERVTRQVRGGEGGGALSGLPLGAYCIRVVEVVRSGPTVNLAEGIVKFEVGADAPVSEVVLPVSRPEPRAGK